MINELEGFDLRAGSFSPESSVICELIKWTKEQNKEMLFNCISKLAVYDDGVYIETSHVDAVVVDSKNAVKIYLHITHSWTHFRYSLNFNSKNCGIRFTFFVNNSFYLKQGENTIKRLRDCIISNAPFYMDYNEGYAVISPSHPMLSPYSHFIKEAYKKIGYVLDEFHSSQFIISKIISNEFSNIKKQFDAYRGPYVWVALANRIITSDNEYIMRNGTIFNEGSFEIYINCMRFRSLDRIQSMFKGSWLATIKVGELTFRFIFSLHYQQIILFCLHMKVNEISLLDYDEYGFDFEWIKRFSPVVFGPNTYTSSNADIDELVVDFFGLGVDISKQL